MVMRYVTGNALTGYVRTAFDNNLNEAVSGNGVYSGLATTQSGTPDWNANVAAGFWRAGGTDCLTTGSTAVAITNSSGLTAGQTRYDLITANNANTITVVNGTAALTAIANIPALPANKIGLAVITVAYGQSAVETANILDIRVDVDGGESNLHFVTSDATAANDNTAATVTLKTISLTAVQANYDRLIVSAKGKCILAGYATTPTTSTLEICVVDTAKSDSVHAHSVASISFTHNHFPRAILIAGTDYTKGAATTLKIKSIINFGAGAGATTYYENCLVEGVRT